MVYLYHLLRSLELLVEHLWPEGLWLMTEGRLWLEEAQLVTPDINKVR